MNDEVLAARIGAAILGLFKSLQPGEEFVFKYIQDGVSTPESIVDVCETLEREITLREVRSANARNYSSFNH